MYKATGYGTGTGTVLRFSFLIGGGVQCTVPVDYGTVPYSIVHTTVTGGIAFSDSPIKNLSCWPHRIILNPN